MLVIRLTKVGKKGEAKYRVIVKEKRDRRDGSAVELLGWMEKTSKGTKMELKKERIAYWQSVGASMSPTVQKLIQSK